MNDKFLLTEVVPAILGGLGFLLGICSCIVGIDENKSGTLIFGGLLLIYSALMFNLLK